MRKQLALALSLTLSFITLMADNPELSTNATPAVKIIKELQFTEGDEHPLTLDLYLPVDREKPTPCVIVIQGGGFRAQDGQRFRPFAQILAENGFVAALISYRGLPNDDYRASMADVKASVRYVRAISEEYSIDPERIGAFGRSAGGTLAVLLALTAEVSELEGDRGHADQSSQVQAVVGIAGVYDFVGRYTDAEQLAMQPKYEPKIKSNEEWIGASFAVTDPDWLRVSAVNQVDASDPPILLLHARNDNTVPWPQSQAMHEAAQRAGGESTLSMSEKGGHGGPPDSKKQMVAFFKETLAK